ncbi:Noc2p family-domain-containing protein [Polychytrium aggregatum]|uniref:Noc2p family-domain-containing protein n=1 Tax=Polychytrium aggregatum TaxID=110093 RepID=UPI0022FE7D94|nr:Noc2p family-domain-containing protein [Polychytrium aggregatum]KAI9207968.1 Noc2p family-domain-containing protein [Polychytrium aggregatum]
MSPRLHIQELDENLSDDDEDLDGFEADDAGEDEADLDAAENAAGTSEISQNKKAILKEIEEHKKQLEALKEKDPEFYKYLQENDQGLLDFEDDGMDDDDDEDEDAEDLAGDDDDDQGMDEDDAQVHDNVVTKTMVSAWKDSLIKTQSLRAAKRILLAFKAATTLDQSEDESKASLAYVVDDTTVFNSVVLTTIKYVPSVFNTHLGVTAEKPYVPKIPQSGGKWKKIHPLAKSFIGNLVKLLSQITDTTMLQFVLRESEALIPYIVCFPKQGKGYLKELLKLWTSANEQIRIVSFLCMRKLAVTQPTPYLDSCLKGAYLAYVSQSKITNVYTWTQIDFSAGCLVELCGLHPVSTYQHAFVYIRQLAIHLRNAITQKTKESFKMVYNWQFLHSLRLWSRVMQTYCDRSSGAEPSSGMSMRPLIYPFVQVALGALRLKPSAKFFPFRFHIVRLLIQLSNKTGTYIPLAAQLFEVFESAELRNKAKPSTAKPMDFIHSIKAPNNYLGTRVYQNNVVDEVVGLMSDYFASFALSISFPELVVPAIIQIKRFVKKSKNFTANKQLQQLVEKLEQNSQFIESRRSNVDFSPRDEGKCMNFLQDLDPAVSPLYKYNAARQKLKDQQNAKLVESDEDEEEDELEAELEGEDEDEDELEME